MAKGGVRDFLSEALPVLLVTPGLLMIAVPGPITVKEIFIGYVALLVYFGPGLLAASVVSGLSVRAARARSQVTLYGVAILVPAVVLPMVLIVSFAVHALRSIALIQNGGPYVGWSAVGGVASGIIFILNDRLFPREKRRRPRKGEMEPVEPPLGLG